MIRVTRREGGQCELLIEFLTLNPSVEAAVAYGQWLTRVYTERQRRGLLGSLHIRRNYRGITAWQLAAAAGAKLAEVELEVERRCASSIHAVVQHVTIEAPTCMFASRFRAAVDKQPKAVPTTIV